ncbi:hypothetical protein CDD82_1845 [Ophiocordyceps australis]|uniref:Uncharacterized protein n=1 Tax=Ophiocordyceps australis TaxID=1399860 RepID=A0A2C5ZH17_9HYPO|nr:hypothetical protein CDD82_1845 [Ophiocordyceps australis]
MDDPSRRRRQNEPPVQHQPSQRYQLQIASPHSSSFSGTAPERYRPAPLSNTSPSTPRSMGVAGGYSSYYQEPQSTFATPNMSAPNLSYANDYGSDTRSQGQSFGSYNAGMMMYNVPQPNTSTSVYDTQHFAQQRQQQAAIHMMAPDVASTYFGSETGAASTSGMQQQQQQQHASQNSGPASSDYPQHGAPLNYAGGMPSVNAMHQHHQHQQSHSAASTAAPDGQAHDYHHDAALQQKWVNYQQQLGTVFHDIKIASLETASETLLGLSTWLLTQVADLGLVQDDATLHDERIKLWNDFNHAWLALGFQQKKLMESGQKLSRSQSLLSEDTIKKMGDEIIRLCDGIERHGLVDYQYGVWEEEIEQVLEDCLDLFEASRGHGSVEESH